jgi:hypothetical protein
MISGRMRKRYERTSTKGLREEDARLSSEIARLTLRLETVRQIQREREDRRGAHAGETTEGGGA